jgi:hypothetical protein
MLEDAIRVLKGAWWDEPYNFSGEHHQIQAYSTLPTPVQLPPPSANDRRLDMPGAFSGSIEQIVEQMWECREGYGFSYIVALQGIDELVPIVARLAGK